VVVFAFGDAHVLTIPTDHAIADARRIVRP
jgi:hypothetical protein